MARLWQTVLLAQWKPVFAELPVESQVERYQEVYYDATADCHRAGNSNLFIEFMLQRILETLQIFSVQVASDAAVSPCVERLMECMAPGVSYSAVQLLTLLGLKSRQTLRMHYLDPAMQEGLVEMTIPEKPSSRNQRYRRTTSQPTSQPTGRPTSQPTCRSTEQETGHNGREDSRFP